MEEGIKFCSLSENFRAAKVKISKNLEKLSGVMVFIEETLAIRL